MIENNQFNYDLIQRNLSYFICIDKFAYIKNDVKTYDKCRCFNHDFNCCFVVNILRLLKVNVNILQFFKRFRSMIKQIVREFEKIQQQNRVIFVVTKKRREKICELMQK